MIKAASGSKLIQPQGQGLTPQLNTQTQQTQAKSKINEHIRMQLKGKKNEKPEKEITNLSFLEKLYV